MNAREVVEKISFDREVHLHAILAGPVLTDGTKVKRWTFMEKQMNAKFCGDDDRCVRVSLDELP